ncbi:response regulator transcription factor [Mesorhizobium sp. M6A.T.Ce.TU.016.01.1.1]|uniref:response regulator transcription factor n=1 Tax=Mesorhizobium sp. M6A.T.Ce.TU.016.01.1.1 TaxID=2496783 RepID=UPI000FCA949D|nr:response regulator transcription factor [Mesorhizobium sp. M6A.T.Ce.TU.016.01.1.1]RUU27883.1 response regulator transcription factor [Mesorhizobium sp. M6A.T.Ce.TU.016.01.1.1]
MSTLVVADPRGVYLAGLEWVLRKAGHSVVANCHRIIDVVPHVERHRPDIVVIGVDIASQQTASLSSRLRTMNSALGIIFILQPNGGFGVKDIQELDADGLLLDGISHSYLVECVNVVAAGRKWVDNNILQHLLMPISQHHPEPRLTGREAEVASLVVRGFRNKNIAEQLHVSEGTVKMHLHHVYEKLHLSSRAELAWATFDKAADYPGTGHKSGL